MSRASHSTASIIVAFFAGVIITAAFLLSGQFPNYIISTEKIDQKVIGDTAWLDEVDASFPAESTPLHGTLSPSDAYAQQITARKAKLANMAINRDNNEFWDDQEFFSDSQPNPKDTDGLNGALGSISPSDAYAQHVAAREARLAKMAEEERNENSKLDEGGSYPAFMITILQAITFGIAFGIGFLINQSGLKLWRMFIGISAGVLIGWWLGMLSWVFVFASNSPTAAMVNGLPRSFLFAILGAALGVYFGREKARNRASKVPDDGSSLTEEAVEPRGK